MALQKMSFNGVASPFIKGNQFERAIVKLLKEEATAIRDSAGHQPLQLYFAVVGDCHQCPVCCKYFKDRRLFNRH
jgi:Holliday junction resolvase